MERVYLDWAATTAVNIEILKKALEQSIIYSENPSSPHDDGKKARAFIESCRESLASLFGTTKDRLIFTSGATESNNIVINSLIPKQLQKHSFSNPGNIVISAIEHASVYEPVKALEKYGWEIREVLPEANGIISAESFVEKIDKNTRLAAIIMINNETGAIQPVYEIGRLLSEKNFRKRVHYHIDAVQAAGKYPLNLDNTKADSASISSHKFQGPRGAGILYLNKEISPIYSGGGQERNLRSGTENTFAIAGTLLAAEKALQNTDENLKKAIKYKKLLLETINNIPNAFLNPLCKTSDYLNPEKYSPYIISVGIKPVPGEVLVRVLSSNGFDVSTGSACSAGKKGKSRVLNAFGIDNESAFSTIRISTGCGTEVEEISQFCDTLIRETTILVNSLSK
ncbi:MAG: cysteine desulfurase family protein [Spirochaetales bacterium]|nr:cysteine desulfurase family protein [Spirochaetales bacterium]